ncbi:MAG TPA: histidine phosphatase family protein [Gemmatirosa sp.]
MTVYLVRHGEIDGAEGRCIGHTDLPLAPAGHDTLAHLAARWTLPHAPLLISSDLLRARESAQLLAEGWGLTAPIPSDARLREMHFGRWDGKLWAEIERDDGEAFGEWMANWQDARTPGGEGFGDVIARAGEWLREVEERAREEAKTEVVAVAHAGSIRALLVEAEGETREGVFRKGVGYGEVRRVRRTRPA